MSRANAGTVDARLRLDASQARKEAKRVAQTFKGLTSTLNKLAAGFGLTLTVDFVVRNFAKLLSNATEITKQFELQNAALTAIIQGQERFLDLSGQQIPVEQARVQALTEANRLLTSITQGGLRPALQTSKEFLGTVTALLPTFRQFGVSLEDSVPLMQSMADAAALTSIPLDEMVNQSRQILSSNISNETKLAKIVGLNNQIVNQAKIQGTLTQVLESRFGALSRNAALVRDSLAGAQVELRNVVQLQVDKQFQDARESSRQLALELSKLVSSNIGAKLLKFAADIKQAFTDAVTATSRAIRGLGAVESISLDIGEEAFKEAIKGTDEFAKKVAALEAELSSALAARRALIREQNRQLKTISAGALFTAPRLGVDIANISRRIEALNKQLNVSRPLLEGVLDDVESLSKIELLELRLKFVQDDPDAVKRLKAEIKAARQETEKLLRAEIEAFDPTVISQAVTNFTRITSSLNVQLRVREKLAALELRSLGVNSKLATTIAEVSAALEFEARTADISNLAFKTASEQILKFISNVERAADSIPEIFIKASIFELNLRKDLEKAREGVEAFSKTLEGVTDVERLAFTNKLRDSIEQTALAEEKLVAARKKFAVESKNALQFENALLLTQERLGESLTEDIEGFVSNIDALAVNVPEIREDIAKFAEGLKQGRLAGKSLDESIKDVQGSLSTNGQQIIKNTVELGKSASVEAAISKFTLERVNLSRKLFEATSALLKLNTDIGRALLDQLPALRRLIAAQGGLLGAHVDTLEKIREQNKALEEQFGRAIQVQIESPEAIEAPAITIEDTALAGALLEAEKLVAKLEELSEPLSEADQAIKNFAEQEVRALRALLPPSFQLELSIDKQLATSSRLVDSLKDQRSERERLIGRLREFIANEEQLSELLPASVEDLGDNVDALVAKFQTLRESIAGSIDAIKQGTPELGEQDKRLISIQESSLRRLDSALQFLDIERSTTTVLQTAADAAVDLADATKLTEEGGSERAFAALQIAEQRRDIAVELLEATRDLEGVEGAEIDDQKALSLEASLRRSFDNLLALGDAVEDFDKRFKGSSESAGNLEVSIVGAVDGARELVEVGTAGLNVIEDQAKAGEIRAEQEQDLARLRQLLSRTAEIDSRNALSLAVRTADAVQQILDISKQRAALVEQQEVGTIEAAEFDLRTDELDAAAESLGGVLDTLEFETAGLVAAFQELPPVLQAGLEALMDQTGEIGNAIIVARQSLSVQSAVVDSVELEIDSRSRLKELKEAGSTEEIVAAQKALQLEEAALATSKLLLDALDKRRNSIEAANRLTGEGEGLADISVSVDTSEATAALKQLQIEIEETSALASEEGEVSGAITALRLGGVEAASKVASLGKEIVDLLKQEVPLTKIAVASRKEALASQQLLVADINTRLNQVLRTNKDILLEDKKVVAEKERQRSSLNANLFVQQKNLKAVEKNLELGLDAKENLEKQAALRSNIARIENDLVTSTDRVAKNRLEEFNSLSLSEKLEDSIVKKLESRDKGLKDRLDALRGLTRASVQSLNVIRQITTSLSAGVALFTEVELGKTFEQIEASFKKTEAALEGNLERQKDIKRELLDGTKLDKDKVTQLEKQLELLVGTHKIAEEVLKFKRDELSILLNTVTTADGRLNLENLLLQAILRESPELLKLLEIAEDRTNKAKELNAQTKLQNKLLSDQVVQSRISLDRQRLDLEQEKQTGDLELRQRVELEATPDVGSSREQLQLRQEAERLELQASQVLDRNEELTAQIGVNKEKIRANTERTAPLQKQLVDLTAREKDLNDALVISSAQVADLKKNITEESSDAAKKNFLEAQIADARLRTQRDLVTATRGTVQGLIEAIPKQNEILENTSKELTIRQQINQVIAEQNEKLAKQIVLESKQIEFKKFSKDIESGIKGAVGSAIQDAIDGEFDFKKIAKQFAAQMLTAGANRFVEGFVRQMTIAFSGLAAEFSAMMAGAILSIIGLLSLAAVGGSQSGSGTDAGLGDRFDKRAEPLRGVITGRTTIPIAAVTSNIGSAFFTTNRILRQIESNTRNFGGGATQADTGGSDELEVDPVLTQ